MEFNKSEAAIPGGATAVKASAPGSEIDLYDELINFSGLSPEEQLRLLALPKESFEEAVEAPNSGSLYTGDKTGPVEVETAALEAENASQPDASIPIREVSDVTSEASDGSNLSKSIPPLSNLTPASSDSESSKASDSTALPPAPLASPKPTVKGKTGDLGTPGYDRSRTGPLLAGLNMLPEFIFAGDLSLGVCLACGAESGADDLFCVSCGMFIDEIGSTPKSSPTCGECGQRVTTDEIFCPWCGAAPPA